jgi:hypothetical protein
VPAAQFIAGMQAVSDTQKTEEVDIQFEGCVKN